MENKSQEKQNGSNFIPDVDKLSHIIKSMQTFNYNSDYDKTIQLYDKYREIVSDNDFISNQLLNEYELAKHKIILDSKPRNVMIVLTNTCDINCVMCYQNRDSVRNISKKLVDIVLDNMRYFERLTWQGGEVLILPYFKDILLKTLQFPVIHQTIISNFQNVSDEVTELIAKNNMTLTISIDGAFKETYEKIRIGASFDRLEKNLKKLNEYILKYKSFIIMKINFVIMKINYKEIPDIIDFAYRHNVPIVSFMRCISKNDNIRIAKEDENEVASYIKKAQEKADKYNIRIINTFFSEYNDTEKSPIEEKKGLFCHLPWHEMIIHEDDTIKPHCACGYANYVNAVNCNDIYDMWNGEVMQKYRKQLLKNEYGRCIGECNLVLSYNARKNFNG